MHNASETTTQTYTTWGDIPATWDNVLPTAYTPNAAGHSSAGQREANPDGGIRLLDYNARHYYPFTGRFISPDTIVPEPGNPQALNRYSYVLNNPLRFVDPSGYDPLDAAWQEEFYSVHGREPTAEDMLIRLFSIAFPDEWDWNNFYTSDGQLLEGATRGIFTRGSNWT